MGVRGLTTLMKETGLSSVGKHVSFSSNTNDHVVIVIDGNAFTHWFCIEVFGASPSVNTNYSVLSGKIDIWLDGCTSAGASCIFVFDGATELGKLDCKLSRMDRQARDVHSFLVDAVNTEDGNSKSKLLSVPPLLAIRCILEAIERSGCARAFFAYGEADRMLAHVALATNAVGIMTNDTDIICYNDGDIGFIPFWGFGFSGEGGFHAHIITGRRLASVLGIKPSNLSLLAALVGNDFSQSHVLDDIHKLLLSRKWSAETLLAAAVNIVHQQIIIPTNGDSNAALESSSDTDTDDDHDGDEATGDMTTGLYAIELTSSKAAAGENGNKKRRPDLEDSHDNNSSHNQTQSNRVSEKNCEGNNKRKCNQSKGKPSAADRLKDRKRAKRQSEKEKRRLSSSQTTTSSTKEEFPQCSLSSGLLELLRSRDNLNVHIDLPESELLLSEEEGINIIGSQRRAEERWCDRGIYSVRNPIQLPISLVVPPCNSNNCQQSAYRESAMKTLSAAVEFIKAVERAEAVYNRNYCNITASSTNSNSTTTSTVARKHGMDGSDDSGRDTGISIPLILATAYLLNAAVADVSIMTGSICGEGGEPSTASSSSERADRASNQRQGAAGTSSSTSTSRRSSSSRSRSYCEAKYATRAGGRFPAICRSIFAAFEASDRHYSVIANKDSDSRGDTTGRNDILEAAAANTDEGMYCCFNCSGCTPPCHIACKAMMDSNKSCRFNHRVVVKSASDFVGQHFMPEIEQVLKMRLYLGKISCIHYTEDAEETETTSRPTTAAGGAVEEEFASVMVMLQGVRVRLYQVLLFPEASAEFYAAATNLLTSSNSDRTPTSSAAGAVRASTSTSTAALSKPPRLVPPSSSSSLQSSSTKSATAAATASATVKIDEAEEAATLPVPKVVHELLRSESSHIISDHALLVKPPPNTLSIGSRVVVLESTASLSAATATATTRSYAQWRHNSAPDALQPTFWTLLQSFLFGPPQDGFQPGRQHDTGSRMLRLRSLVKSLNTSQQAISSSSSTGSGSGTSTEEEHHQEQCQEQIVSSIYCGLLAAELCSSSCYSRYRGSRVSAPPPGNDICCVAVSFCVSYIGRSMRSGAVTITERATTTPRASPASQTSSSAAAGAYNKYHLHPNDSMVGLCNDWTTIQHCVQHVNYAVEVAEKFLPLLLSEPLLSTAAAGTQQGSSGDRGMAAGDSVAAAYNNANASRGCVVSSLDFDLFCELHSKATNAMNSNSGNSNSNFNSCSSSSSTGRNRDSVYDLVYSCSHDLLLEQCFDNDNGLKTDPSILSELAALIADFISLPTSIALNNDCLQLF